MPIYRPHGHYGKYAEGDDLCEAHGSMLRDFCGWRNSLKKVQWSKSRESQKLVKIFLSQNWSKIYPKIGQDCKNIWMQDVQHQEIQWLKSEESTEEPKLWRFTNCLNCSFGLTKWGKNSKFKFWNELKLKMKTILELRIHH